MKRVPQKDYDSNKQYASEVLSILLQGGREVVLRVWEKDGVEGLMNVLAVSCYFSFWEWKSLRTGGEGFMKGREPKRRMYGRLSDGLWIMD